MKIKNPFKKGNIMDTVVNVGIGGAADVAVDYAMANIDMLSSLEESTKNYVKIGIGILGGALTGNKYLRAAVDGIAVVGVSNVVAGIVNGETSTQGQSGLPEGTIGRLRAGNRYYHTGKRVSGLNPDFMQV